VAKTSLAHSAHESTTEERVECFRCAGEDCPKCGGSGYRERKRCAECGEPSGRISEGSRPLLSLPNNRNRNQPMWCVHCHPESRFVDVVWSGLERMDG
jgi:hypothetical protein